MFYMYQSAISKVLRWARKVFSFCIPVCLSRDSGRRNFPICLKFGTNVFVLCKISRMVFEVHCLKSAFTRMHKNISIRNILAYKGKFFENSFDMVLCIKLNEIYIRYSDVQ